MKRFAALLALIFAAAGCAQTSAPGSGGNTGISDTVTGSASAVSTTSEYPDANELNAAYSMQAKKNRNVCDALYYHAEDNVKLTLLRCQDQLFAYCSEPVSCTWAEMYYEGDIPLENGEFGYLTADVIFESGGIDGRVNRPKIRRTIDFEKTDLAHVLEAHDLPVWEEGFTGNSSIVIFNTDDKQYCLFRCRGGKPVDMPDGGRMYEQYNGWFAILDGEVTGYYEYGRYTLDDVITLLSGGKLMTDGYDVTITNSETIMAFRIGDKYYSVGTSIFLNGFPTPLYNEQLENRLPEGNELKDGECALIRADLKLLNGQGWVRVPMLTDIRSFEICDYDVFIRKAGVVPVTEYDTRGEYDLCDVMFDRNSGGTWLIFIIDGKYHLYRERLVDGRVTGEPMGCFDTLADATDAMN